MPTDKLFTGQRLDDTGLYYYNARYYDPLIGRFISPDTIVPNFANPQSFNRYSYCLNNPLKYVDPSGRDVEIEGIGNVESINDITTEQWLWLAMSGRANEVMALFNAYQEVRELAPTETGILESADEVYTIGWGDTGCQLDSVFNVETGQITISNDLRRVDSFYISNRMLGDVYDAADNFISIGDIVGASYYYTNDLLTHLPDNDLVAAFAFGFGCCLTAVSGIIIVVSSVVGDIPTAFAAVPFFGVGMSLTVYGFNQITDYEYNLWSPAP